ncbi:uncharacterized protein LOC120111744 [Phoenix dactylifera]|uniref:Uncharacterized protein LOC120111744 n=1 Tax=Phoenix dactylifera TaxID=42345 RepID=A0A8B9ANG9_PHODC|nr:uncharacterized protein LOC120111744 [Phoenix dactylifera]
MASTASGEEDELALVKAAARAWYQHGSGNEGRAGREFVIPRGGAARSPRPSRYKLEALAAVSGSPEPGPGTSTSLLDLYELERITRELDRLIAASSTADDHRMRRKEPEERKVVARKMSGFWMRHAVAICGTRGDVVEAPVLASRRRSKPATVV